VGPGVLATVRGTVASEAGEAVEAEVHLRTLDTKDMPDLRVDARSTSSRGGTFSLRAPPGRYALLVSSPAWGAAGRFVDTAALTEEPLSLVLRRGTRVVLTPPETRGGSVRYSLRDAEDRIVWARIARLETVVLRVVLTPGRYTLHAETDTGTRHEQAFEVGSSPSRVAVAIPR
jgi:hypothetical protein